MKKFKWLVIFGNLILLLVYYNYTIYKKEILLREGQLVLLELAPSDPRSLMQGDYMTLRYKISENMENEIIPKRGYCVVNLDSNKVGEKLRFQPDQIPLSSGEYLIKYTAPDIWTINIGAESYFFQEGQGDKFAMAKYGGIKVDNQGNSLLIGLYDSLLRKIE